MYFRIKKRSENLCQMTGYFAFRQHSITRIHSAGSFPVTRATTWCWKTPSWPSRGWPRKTGHGSSSPLMPIGKPSKINVCFRCRYFNSWSLESVWPSMFLPPSPSLPSGCYGVFQPTVWRRPPLYSIASTRLYLRGHWKCLTAETFVSYHRYIWHRTNFALAHSEVEIRWWVTQDVTPGTYRIRHFGHHKQLLFRQIEPYEGSTNNFSVRLFNPVFVLSFFSSKEIQTRDHTIAIAQTI